MTHPGFEPLDLTVVKEKIAERESYEWFHPSRSDINEQLAGAAGLLVAEIERLRAVNGG
jgi:hypothetical protein